MEIGMGNRSCDKKGKVAEAGRTWLPKRKKTRQLSWLDARPDAPLRSAAGA
jgi:hypothetical protein